MVDIANLVATQHVLLNEASTRSDILGSTVGRPRFGLRTVRVHRNHNFELMEPLLAVYSQYAGFDIKTVVGSYDDSIALQDLGEVDSDVEILWIDYSRYTLEPAALVDFMASRLLALRKISAAPILVANYPHPEQEAFNMALAMAIKDMAGVYVLPLSELAGKEKIAFYDHTRAQQFGTAFNARILPKIARLLGLQYLPALLRPRIKAIAIDLDNTLYCGVLGEDGVKGVHLTDGHQRLQEALVHLGQSGVLLSITSKNVEEDVIALFTQRNDFPLRLEHLAGKQVNWDGKAENIRKLAAAFNISPNDFLLLDDNPGEIAQTIANIELIDVLHASDDGDVTVAELATFPGLLSFGVTDVDRKRTQDIIARQQRMEEQQGQSVEQYLAQMETSLGIYLNDEAAFKRLCEIPIKTNQFNLALQRLPEARVRTYLDDPDAFVVSMSLKDKLSNSGNVGAIYGRIEGAALVIEEVCVSCRALGRGVEDFMIARALETMILATAKTLEQLRFMYRFGPRNQPAIKWLEKFTQSELPAVPEKIEDESSPLASLDYPLAQLRDYLERTRSFPINVFSQTSF